MKGPITSVVKLTAFYNKNLIPTVNHGGGSVMVWGGFAGSGPEQVAISNEIMNSVTYQKITDTVCKKNVAEVYYCRVNTLL